MNIFRSLLKNRYLRLVNLLGLALIFASLLLSYAYVKHELSYDRFHAKADRIVRVTMSWSNETSTECRVYDGGVDALFRQLPEVDQIVKLYRYSTFTFTCNNKQEVVNNVYNASGNFFRVFDYPLVAGDKMTVLDAPNKVAVSESFARRLFGNVSPLGKTLRLKDNRETDDGCLVVSGVFKDFPDNSHLHTEMLLYREKERHDYAYTYLLFKKQQPDLSPIEKKLTDLFNKTGDKSIQITIGLMPLTDIHLHSKCSREMEPNGNIQFIYLVAGGNLLLLLIVLLNVWINAGLIFASRRRYYQLLRINGAANGAIVREDFQLALASSVAALLLGAVVAWFLAPLLHIDFSWTSPVERLVICAGFVLLSVAVTLLPMLLNVPFTLFQSSRIDLRPARRSLYGVRYLLAIQYAVVMLIVILTFGIGRQVSLIMQTQAGGSDSCVIVMKEQPNAVKQRLPLLKSELLKHPEIESVTAAMQLPGEGIRDGIEVMLEGKSDKIQLHVLVVGDDFIPFFGLRMLAGTVLPPDKYTYRQHLQLIINQTKNLPNPSGLREGYVINRKAMRDMGFRRPEDAIGKTLHIDKKNSLSYIPEGTICGVVEDFTFTTLFEENIPLVIFSRALFAQCFMIRLNGNDMRHSIGVFNDVWKKINPEFPPNFSFLKNEYGRVYHNELNAEALVRLFSLLCLLITSLGLLVFVSFTVKNRTREVAIRRVNGASVWQIVRLLNFSYIRWIGLAFIVAVPVSYYLMQRWLENFAYKTTLDWWIFATAGVSVLLISILLVSWQTWRAANVNPVDSLKTE